MKYKHFLKDNWQNSLKEEIDNLNSVVPIKEFDFLDKNFPSKQTKINLPIHQKPIYKIWQRNNANFIQILREKQLRREHFSIHHMEPASSSFQNQTDVIRKSNYRPVCLMNIDANLKKTPPNRTQHLMYICNVRYIYIHTHTYIYVHISQQSGVNPREENLVQHSKINQSSPYQ